MVSKARPKRLSCICNAQGEEKEFRFLFKIDYDGDIRNESQSSKLIYFMNSVLEQQMIHYSIIGLTNRVCLIEWVEQTDTLSNQIQNMMDYNKVKRYHMHNLIQMNQFKHYDDPNIKHKMLNYQRSQPQVLHSMYKQFTPGSYYKRQYAYTQSLAVWTAYSLLVGLGDRHLGNLLIHTPSSALLFIDYESSFQQSKMLKVPELVPIRLTKNIQAALGSLGLQGLFRYLLYQALRAIVTKKHEILAQLKLFALNRSSKNAQITFSHIDKVSKQFTKEGINTIIDKLFCDVNNKHLLNKMYIFWDPHV